MVNSDQAAVVDIPVIVLAGGLGSRLKSVVSDRPKILAQIEGKPFLAILLQWLVSQGVSRVTFSLGYMAEQVIEQLLLYKTKIPLEITYVVEPQPIGTLGGLSLALNKQNITESIVINGDTFVDVNLAQFVNDMRAKNSDMGLVSIQVNNVSRYGQVLLNDDGMVNEFIEKESNNTSAGWINAGIYYFSADTINKLVKCHSGSIEYDFLIPHCKQLKSFKVTQGRFIDIGTPESYQQAPLVLQEYII